MNKFVILLSCLFGLTAAGVLDPMRMLMRNKAIEDREQIATDRIYRMTRDELLRQKFLLDVLMHVQQPLVNEELLRFGQELITDPQRYLDRFDEVMLNFIELCRTQRVLGPQNTYSITNEDHLRQMIGLYRMLVNARDWDTFQRNVCFARIHINGVLLVNSLMLAVRDREDTRALIMPAIYDILPVFFYDENFARKAQQLDIDLLENETRRPGLFDLIGIGRRRQLLQPNGFAFNTAPIGVLDRTQLWMPWRELHVDMAMRKARGETTNMFVRNEDKIVLPVERRDREMSLLTDDIGLNGFINNLINDLVLNEYETSRDNRVDSRKEQYIGRVALERNEGTILERERLMTNVDDRRNDDIEDVRDTDRMLHVGRRRMLKRMDIDVDNDRRVFPESRIVDGSENSENSIIHDRQSANMYSINPQDVPTTTTVDNERLLHINRRRMNDMNQRDLFLNIVRGANINDGRRVVGRKQNFNDDRNMNRERFMPQINEERTTDRDFNKYREEKERPNQMNMMRGERQFNGDVTKNDLPTRRIDDERLVHVNRYRLEHELLDNNSEEMLGNVRRRTIREGHGVRYRDERRRQKDDKRRKDKDQQNFNKIDNRERVFDEKPLRYDREGVEGQQKNVEYTPRSNYYNKPQLYDNEHPRFFEEKQRSTFTKSRRFDEKVEDQQTNFEYSPQTNYYRRPQFYDNERPRVFEEEQRFNFVEPRRFDENKHRVNANEMNNKPDYEHRKMADDRTMFGKRKINEDQPQFRTTTVDDDRLLHINRRRLHQEMTNQQEVNDKDFVESQRFDEKVEDQRKNFEYHPQPNYYKKPQFYDNERPRVVEENKRFNFGGVEDQQKNVDYTTRTNYYRRPQFYDNERPRVFEEEQRFNFVEPRRFDENEQEVNANEMKYKPGYERRNMVDDRRMFGNRKMDEDQQQFRTTKVDDDRLLHVNRRRFNEEMRTQQEVNDEPESFSQTVQHGIRDGRRILKNDDDSDLNTYTRNNIDDERVLKINKRRRMGMTLDENPRTDGNEQFAQTNFLRGMEDIGTERFGMDRNVNRDRRMKFEQNRKDMRQQIDDDDVDERTDNDNIRRRTGINDQDRLLVAGRRRRVDIGNVDTVDRNMNMGRRVPRSLNNDVFNRDQTFLQRGGELFLHNLQQLMARIDMERISLRLNDFEMQDVDSQLYNPRLVDDTNIGERWAVRINNMRLDTRRNRILLQRINEIEQRVLMVIERELQRTSIRDQQDINRVISNILLGRIENTPGLLQIIRDLMQESTEGEDANTVFQPNMVTMLRDPIMQYLLRRIVRIVDGQRQRLDAYRRDEIALDAVRINDVSVDRLRTFVDDYDADLINLREQRKMLLRDQLQQKMLVARQQRLNHKNFDVTIDLTVEREQRVVVRTFLVPKIDANDRVMRLDDTRLMAMLLDSAVFDLSAGQNVIKRKSSDINWTTRDTTPLTMIYQRVMRAIDGKFEPVMPVEFIVGNNCQFPHRLLLPRGRVDGLLMQLLVVVTPVTDFGREFEENIRDRRHMCGIGVDRFNVDRLPFNFPLDRRIADVDQFLDMPNVMVKDVMILHEEK